MEPLDGNAIAGQLFDVFGVEMTTASGTCASCGATAQIAELMVYLRAPGAVVRCPVCGAVLIVLTELRGTHARQLHAASSCATRRPAATEGNARPCRRREPAHRRDRHLTRAEPGAGAADPSNGRVRSAPREALLIVLEPIRIALSDCSRLRSWCSSETSPSIRAAMLSSLMPTSYGGRE